jgi:diguanylate cyclase (GGDEF)-like protein/putative nucleotidyltransferase with HDIG domain/PAS domain S-box-containing protein
MDPSPQIQPGAPTVDSGAVGVANIERLGELSKLLSDLEETPHVARNAPLKLTTTQENALIQVRLGLASSLYTALKWKHEPTAMHCLRVALTCSAWVHRIGLPPERRDEIEVAALLHDVGKIGVPEAILNKPGPLFAQEVAVIDGHWLVGLEILRSCCASKTLQDILLYTPAWFDGSKRGQGIIGENIPLGSRIVAIVDAFDSMTSEQIYRPALSRERAFQELYQWSGRQFDPRLVKSFCELHDSNESKLLELVPRRWLQQLDPKEVNAIWKLNDGEAPSPQLYQLPLFQERLVEQMDDATIFLDAALRVIRWNPGAERLTGLSAESAYLRNWTPTLLHLRNENGCVIHDEQCPMAYALTTRTAWAGRVNLRNAEGHIISVKAQASPVMSEDGTPQGLVVLLHDASHEASLQEHCQNLRDIATRDPLTQLANRAEFDHLFDVFVTSHTESKKSCSLIITDIDLFKQVNDVYGHQAGDEVIRAFAAVLKGSCRSGDLVARYGGEEFVMLCADCDSATVFRRADQLRTAFARTQHESMGGKKVTASFGVTEMQPGDTPDTMLRRADRALLVAKEEGRNKVVQLGSGQETADKPLVRVKCKFTAGEALIEQQMASHVPLNVSVEKLRGFIADHHATVIDLKDTRVVLAVTCGPPARPFLSTSERPTRFTMELEFREERDKHETPDGRKHDVFLRTLIKVVIRPEKSRERRQRTVDERARQLLISLRAYLMAVDPISEGGVLRRARNLLNPWRAKK